MKPTKHASTNGFLRANTEHENVIDLPITRVRPPDEDDATPKHLRETYVVSFWEPSPEEVAAIVAGKPVQLTCYAQTHAPIWVSVDGVKGE